jgi:transcriptional regulator with XRE-family HTH domain
LLAGESPIRAFRKLRDLTQAELAERAGISQAAVTAIEGGKRAGSINTYSALARALAVDIDDLAPKLDEDEGGDHAFEPPAAQLTRMGRGEKKGKGLIVQALPGGKAAPKAGGRQKAAASAKRGRQKAPAAPTASRNKA